MKNELLVGLVDPTKHEHLMVLFSTSWADEMDLEGFRFMSSTQWNEYYDTINRLKFPREVYFGTNESNEYDSVEEYLSEITLYSLSKSDSEVLQKYFTGGYFGEYGINIKYLEKEDFEKED